VNKQTRDKKNDTCGFVVPLCTGYVILRERSEIFSLHSGINAIFVKNMV